MIILFQKFVNSNLCKDYWSTIFVTSSISGIILKLLLKILIRFQYKKRYLSDHKFHLLIVYYKFLLKSREAAKQKLCLNFENVIKIFSQKSLHSNYSVTLFCL